MTDSLWWPDHDLPGPDLPGEHPHDPASPHHLDSAEELATDFGGEAFPDESGGWAPYDGDPDVPHTDALNDALHDVVYGTSGLDGVAHDLWTQLLPGVPVPTGLEGAELSGPDLLDELRERVHDPMLGNVIDTMLAEWRG